MKHRPIVLIVLDGWGLSPSWGGNALSMNNPKNIDKLWRNYPHTILQALSVIQKDSCSGDSRLGHTMLGAGRKVQSIYEQINDQISSRQFFKNDNLLGAFEWAKNHNSNVHLLGLLSDGGVHAHFKHLSALLNLAHQVNFKKIFIDVVTDGIDTGPTDALRLIEPIENKIKELKIGNFNSITGRNFAMDRDGRWDKISKYFNTIVGGNGEKFSSIREAIVHSYKQGVSDEFIVPALIEKNGETTPIKDNDAIIFFNFREDRARELTQAFIEPNFKTFLWKPKQPKNLYFSTFINYQKDLPAKVIFSETHYEKTLPAILADADLRQLRVAESEKSAHVTYFFNGGQESPFPGEGRKIVPSPKVDNYDKIPEMSAAAVAKTVIKAVKGKKYDFILTNFANADSVAHTGNILAVGEAVKIVDKHVAEIVKTNHGGATIITADHGNAEQMINLNQNYHGDRETLHTLNPVPFILILPDNQKSEAKSSIGHSANALAKILEAHDTLADVAPTILELMGLPKPKEMDGHSLLNRLE